MPKASKHIALVRQWELLRMLPARRPGITASALVSELRDKGFPVTKRTVERDLIQLSTVFGIRCNDESVPYGWHWLPGAHRDLSVPDMADCLSLVVAEQALRTLLPAAVLTGLEPQFEIAHKKLKAVGAHRYARWADRVRYVPAGAPLLPPRINSSILAAVQEALMGARQLLASYLAPSAPKASELMLHPLAFVQRAGTAYLVATAFGYDDVRLYAIHRFRRAVVSGEAATSPRGFSLDRYLESGAMQFTSGTSVTLNAWVSSELAIQLSETPLSSEQTLTPSGEGYRVIARISDSWQLRWWILSQGDSIRVESPTALREEIRDTLHSALRAYA